MGDLAAELRARYNLRTPEAFLANDTGIKRVSEITILDDLEVPDPKP